MDRVSKAELANLLSPIPTIDQRIVKVLHDKHLFYSLKRNESLIEDSILINKTASVGRTEVFLPTITDTKH